MVEEYICTVTVEGLPEEVRLYNARPLNARPIKSGKTIVQVSRTNCAGAIWRIHDAINTYTEYACRTITASDTTNGRKYPCDVLLSHPSEVRKVLTEANVIHFHNWIDHQSLEMAPYRSILARKRKVLQYHTEPAILQKNYRVDVINRNDVVTLVIAQKHARFYPKSIIVPNLVDIWDPMLRPGIVDNHKRLLKVIYTPSDLKTYRDYTNTCCGKGYPETLAILKRLDREGLIKFTVICDKTWEELMPIKRQYDICIDECVTGGYHLCSLESLSQGLVTIGWLDEETKKAIHRVIGKETELPWVNTGINELELTLRRLVKMDINDLQVLKNRGRRWMEDNWNPAVLIKHFLNVYGLSGEIPISMPMKINGFHYRWERHPTLLPVYQVPGKLLPEALALKNAWQDKRVVIWGNGPTVTEAIEMDFGDAKHIGTNCAVLLHKLHFDVYCIGDKRFILKPEKLAIAKSAPGIRIYQSLLEGDLWRNRISFVETIGNEGFCSDLIRGVYHGYSVVWLALQVALWTGCKDILLAGCGHDYGKQPRFYAEKVPSEVDQTLPLILNDYRQLMPLFSGIGVRLQTIGKSRLAEAGVPQFKIGD